jgi:hypothetical protein
MSDDKVRRLPISADQRLRNRVGKRGVPCVVSERWLVFGEEGHGPFHDGEYIHLDVMTHGADDSPRKLCSLVVTREDVLRALSNVKAPNK